MPRSAQAYYNEAGVGDALAESGLPREEFFLTTKVWITSAGYEKARASIEESMRKLLQEAELAVAQVRACAPAPLWELLRKLNAAQPEKVLASAVCQNEDVLAAWEDGSCDVAVLPFPFAGAKPFLQEQLFVCVPPEHALAKQSSLTFAEINGFNFLLRSELGFWDTLCREKMPASKFLVQTDTAVFDELVNASSLPCFTTDYGQRRLQTAYPGRVNIPLTDTEASVTFFLASRCKTPGL